MLPSLMDGMSENIKNFDVTLNEMYFWGIFLCIEDIIKKYYEHNVHFVYVREITCIHLSVLKTYA